MRPYCSTSTLALYQERRSSLLYPRSLVEEPALFLSKLVPSPRHLRLLARAAVGGAVFSSSPHFGPDPVFNFLRQGTSSPSKKNYKYRSEGQGRRWWLGDVFECRTNHLAARMIWENVFWRTTTLGGWGLYTVVWTGWSFIFSKYPFRQILQVILFILFFQSS